MSKFNVGDKVRIIANLICAGDEDDAMVGVVDTVEYIDGIVVLKNRTRDNQNWMDSELELVEEAKETMNSKTEFKVNDEVKVIKIDTDEDDEQYIGTLGKTGKLIKNDESSIPYKVYFENIDNYFWYRVGQLELANNPEEPITPEDIIKAIIDGTKKMREVTWPPNAYVVFDNGFKYNNGSHCSINGWIQGNWEEYIEQPKPLPKFQPKQFVVNATGDIGIISEHKGYNGNIPEYSVRFNGVTSKTKPTLETELSEVVL